MCQESPDQESYYPKLVLMNSLLTVTDLSAEQIATCRSLVVLKGGLTCPRQKHQLGFTLLSTSSLQDFLTSITMSTSSSKDRYASLEESDISSQEGLLEKEEFQHLRWNENPASFYRLHERSIIWNIALLVLNITICVGYTHWLTSQYSHFQPQYPCEFAFDVSLEKF